MLITARSFIGIGIVDPALPGWRVVAVAVKSLSGSRSVAGATVQLTRAWAA
jgi:hypothetical protein